MIGLKHFWRHWTTAPLKNLEARKIDGTDNNPDHADYGAAGTQFIRLSPASYDYNMMADKYVLDMPRTNYRALSNDVIKQGKEEIPNTAGVADIFTFFGQFLDHDLDLTLEGQEPGPFIVAPIDPMGDPAFSGRMLGIKRSDPIDGTGEGANNPTQHANVLTSFVDASNVYGSSEAELVSLRDVAKPWLMATSSNGNLPPIGDQPGAQFRAGDIRAGENSALTSIHTIWIKEHNYQAAHLKKLHPGWSHDEVFNAAKLIVEAEMQQVVFNEWLPLLVGAENIPAYGGYKEWVDPSVSHEFATAAFRLGHSLLSSKILRMDEAGKSTGDLGLAEQFGNPSFLRDVGSIDTLVRGLAAHGAQELDHRIVEDVRSLLFPSAAGLQVRDLSVLNHLRGLDHGLGTLNEVRAALGLTPYADFDDLTSDATLAALLEEHYGVGGVGKVDLWIGGLIEQDVSGSQIGETFQAIVVDQFVRVRDGDRFYFEERLEDSPHLLYAIKNTSFSDIIKRTTGIEHLQDDAFIAHNRIGGDKKANDLYGTDGHDLIIGFGGADKLYGNKGDDDIFGDAGHDKIWGGWGDDVIHGGAGHDKIWTGEGADRVVIEKKGGWDVVYDFDPYYDAIDLSAFGLRDALSSHLVHQTKWGVRIDLGGGDGVELAGVKKKALSADNFIFDHDAHWFV